MGKNQKEKKSISGSAKTVITYFATIIIVMAVLGGSTLYLLNRYVLNKEVKTDEENNSSANSIYAPSNADNQTILFFGADESNLETAVLIRFLPTKPGVIVVPISKYTVVDSSSNQTLEGVFSSSGTPASITAVENTYGVKIDKYMKMSRRGWSNLITGLGGIQFSVPHDIKYTDFDGVDVYLEADGARATLWGEDLYEIMTFDGYPSGAEFNDRMTASVITAVIQSALPSSSGRTSLAITNMDSIFKSIHEISDTDITAIDFRQKKDAIKYIVNKTQSPALYIIPKGSWDENLFTPSDSANEALSEYFPSNKLT